MSYYWCHVELENLETIQRKTQNFLSVDDPAELLKHCPEPYSFLDTEAYNQAVPELAQSLNLMGITLLKVAAYTVRVPYHGSPHRDQKCYDIRLNIPILNCEGSWTKFWKMKDGISEPEITTLPNGIPYQPYKLHELKLVDQIQITRPTMMRPTEIHSISVNPARLPRITLTLEIDPMPYHLLPDDRGT